MFSTLFILSDMPKKKKKKKKKKEKKILPIDPVTRVGAVPWWAE